MNNNREKMIEYFNTIRPDLSTKSKQLYGGQLEKIFLNSKMKSFDALKLTTRIVNQSIKNKNLDMVLLDGAKQTQNQRLSAFRNIIEANERNIPKNNYSKISKMVTMVGDEIRNSISETAGLNIKSEKEEINMVKWEDLIKFVEDMPITNDIELRNKLILNLMVNNYVLIGEDKYNVLLRVIEYSSLKLWTNKKNPPDDKQNYLWLKEGNNQLYIQHSKTTGGVKRVKDVIVDQVKVKTFPISDNVIELLTKYITDYKIKNKGPLFLNNSKLGELDESFFRKIITTTLKPLAPSITSTIIRKIYENREIYLKNANEKQQYNDLVDHSLGIAETYYKKN